MPRQSFDKMRSDLALLLEVLAAIAGDRIPSERDLALDLGCSREQADDAFHRAIAQVPHNPVVIGFLAYLSGVRRRVAWQREWDRTCRCIGVSQFRTIHSDQHDRIVDAIGIGDAHTASAATKTHLAAVGAAMSAKTGQR